MRMPTLGFPSQKEAIVHLYLKGMSPGLIAQKINGSRNSVNRAIYDHVCSGGERVTPTLHAAPVAKDHFDVREVSTAEWRIRNYLKAVSGARMALEAMSQ